jgi:hypothetical protein
MRMMIPAGIGEQTFCSLIAEHQGSSRRMRPHKREHTRPWYQPRARVGVRTGLDWRNMGFGNDSFARQPYYIVTELLAPSNVVTL